MRFRSVFSLRRWLVLLTGLPVSALLPDGLFLRLRYYGLLGKALHLDPPRTFCEKLQWLKLHDRDPLHTRLADKYAVRSYVEERVGARYLIPLLGLWERPEDIDFAALPERFVLKCTHNSGLGMCICRDKRQLDPERVRRELSRGLRQQYFRTGREWPYRNIPPRIIGEVLLEEESGLRDYKFHCFEGRVRLLHVISGREQGPVTGALFDREYRRLDCTWGYPPTPETPPRPETLEEMIRTAEALAAGIAYVRVDLYQCRGQVRFGEMTFFDGSGFEPIEPPVWEEKLSALLHLPQGEEEHGS